MISQSRKKRRLLSVEDDSVEMSSCNAQNDQEKHQNHNQPKTKAKPSQYKNEFEKKVIEKFKEIKNGNVVTHAEKFYLSRKLGRLYKDVSQWFLVTRVGSTLGFFSLKP